MYSDTSHTKLGLLLAHQDIDVTKFNIIKKIHKSGGWYETEIGILGASHYLKIKNGHQLFCEIFSCAPIIEQGLFYPISYLKKQQFLWEQVFDAKAYQFKLDVVFLDDSKARYDSFINSDPILSHEFPGVVNSEFKPYTAIQIKDTKENMVIETMHVYPEENVAVFTQSKI